MPDLAFYPEYWLQLNAFENPIEFGLNHQSQISRLIDIANYQLEPWPQAKSKLIKALKSNNRFEKYWALIGLTHFSAQAQQAIEPVKALLKNEESPVIQARAIAFLALSSNYDPSNPLVSTIEKTSNVLQILEIMNIATLLHDRKGYLFDIPTRSDWGKADKADKASNNSYQQGVKHYWLTNRIEYLKQ